jgi:hypothetical protein
MTALVGRPAPDCPIQLTTGQEGGLNNYCTRRAGNPSGGLELPTVRLPIAFMKE